ncbi:3'(2'),5'-bisphosphate nucleotidase CysQ, partial [Salmonella enterica subsp. enterica]
LIVAALRELRPGDGLLSEEERDDLARLERERVWIVDPLDGTREYGEGRSDWAVHVGLAIGGAASVGAVSLPALGLVLRSDQLLARPPAPP